MKPFDYIKPKSIAEVSQLLAASNGNARLLAGGTDLTVGLRHGHFETGLVIDIKNAEETKPCFERDGDVLVITGGVTMAKLAEYCRTNGLYPALIEAASVVGSLQIRNRATLIGNICNASPAADTVPVLSAYGAEVEIFGPNGVRRCTVSTFIQGNRKIDLREGELVTAVRIPLTSEPRGCAFERITRRRGVDLATVNLCSTVEAAGQVAIAFGAASPAPLVVTDESGVLADPNASDAARDAILDELVSVARPITDVRASAEYRIAMLKVMARRSLTRAHLMLKKGSRA